MTKIIIIRHGETLWNIEGRAMGHLDSPLSEKGERQAKAIATRLADARIAAIYSSDLGRAVQTASYIANSCHKEIITVPELRERDMGVFSGLTRPEREHRYPNEWQAFLSRDVDFVIPNGESLKHRFERGNAAIVRLAENHPDETIVIVTHDGIVHGFLEYVLSLEPGQDKQHQRPNAAYNCFVYMNKAWSLSVWGDTSHLTHIKCD